jgi:hypothetical protein
MEMAALLEKAGAGSIPPPDAWSSSNSTVPPDRVVLLLLPVAVGKTFDEFAGSVLRAGPESATASRQTIYAAHRVAPHGGSGAYLSERAAPFSRRLYPTASGKRGSTVQGRARCYFSTDGSHLRHGGSVAPKLTSEPWCAGVSRRSFTLSDRALLRRRCAGRPGWSPARFHVPKAAARRPLALRRRAQSSARTPPVYR